jgi:DNA repair protein RadC
MGKAEEVSMGKVEHIPADERPREKAMRYGIENLSNRELLAILIRCGTRGRSALEVADSILMKAEGIRGLAALGMEGLESIKGISHVKALELLSSLELAKRASFAEMLEQDVVRSPDSVYSWLQQKMGDSLQEEFLVLFLDQAHHIQHADTIFKGTTSAAVVSAKDILRQALRYASTDLILVHNHPGGSLSPSKADLITTRKIMEGGALMGIRVLDHILVTKTGCISLAREGMLPRISSEAA